MYKRAVCACVLLMSVGGAMAAAQEGPLVENHYALKKKDKGPKPKVDPALVRAVGDKVAECFEREQDAALSKEDRELLKEYGSEVVYDLAAGFGTTGCDPAERPNKACLARLSDLDCAKLAEPIIEIGWDRNLTPEARAHVAAYATVLARRENACANRAHEEAEIVTGIRSDRLAALIEAQLVIGQCELFSDQIPACESELLTVPCERLVRLNEHGEVQKVCANVLHCVEVPEQ